MAKKRLRELKGRKLGGGGGGKPVKGGGVYFWNAGRAMVVMFIILGGIVTAGGLAYQSDQLYLQDKTNVTSTMPTSMIIGGNQALIVTATDSFGEPLIGEDVKVVLKDTDSEDEWTLFEGVTGDSGSVEPILAIPQEFNGTSGRIVVEAGGETFTKSVSVKSAEEGEAAGARIIISTDKPIYQPDQVIHIRTMGFEGMELHASEKDVTIEVMDPEGNKIFKKVVDANEFGVAALDYALSDQIPSGNYQIKASLGTVAVTNKTVLVKRYVLPRFNIDVEGARTWYTADEVIKGVFKVDYFFGKHVQGNIRVEAKVYRGVWETVYDKEAFLDQNGECKFEIPPVDYAAGLDLNEGNGYLELNVSVTDTGGHKEVKSYLITVARSPIAIVLLSDTNLEGVESTYTAICRYPTGVPVQDANVTFTIGDNRQFKTTDERGIATVSFEYQGEKKMKVLVDKGETTVEEEFDVKASDGIKLVPDGHFYELGDEASFDVFYKGSSMTVYAYYDVISNGFTMMTGHIKLVDGKGRFKFAVDRALSPMAEVRVYKIEPDMKVIRDSVAIAVEGLEGLSVDVLPDKQTYRPGDEVKIDFKVQDAEGNGAPSILGVNVVDLAVFELSERLVGLDEVFWTLNEQYQEPTYQILDYVYMKDSYDLDYDTTVQVFKCMCAEENVFLESSWDDHLKQAIVIRDGNVENFWGFMAVAGVAGYLGLIGLSFRFKRVAVGLVLLMVIITVALSGLLVAYMQEFSQGPAGTNEGDGIRDWDGEGAMPGAMEKDDTMGGGGILPPLWDNSNDGGSKKSQDTDTGGSDKTSADKPTKVRDYFPETWYWNPTLITDGSGMASVSLIAPDSITTWGVDAVASTKDARFGADGANVTVFQEFFVEPDIPVAAVRNDTFDLRILIYNYQRTAEDVNVNLLPADWYVLEEADSIKVVPVQAESVSNATFTIRATKVGTNKVTVTATAGEWSDAIIKPLRVDPDGKMFEEVYNGQLEDESTASHSLVLDPERIELSENAYIKFQASIEAVTIDGADQYIHFVSGCGEQSLSTLNIDVLAYHAYVKSGGAATEKLVEYETVVTQGIQHELQYLMKANNGIGRGIVWFPGDQDVHPWLTSWGLITFQDARTAGFTIDDKIIKDMQDWLVSQQKDDGSWEFPEWGLYEYNHPALKSKRVASTSYIMHALLYSGLDPDSQTIQKANNYIELHVDEHDDDPYVTSIALMALEEGDGYDATRDRLTDRVESLRKTDETNSSSSWSSSSNMISDGNDWGWGYRHGGGDIRAIETTGYAVMALQDSGSKSVAEEGIRYLLSARGPYGWQSTQDTVVAFQALMHAGEAKVENMDVSVYAEGKLVDKVHFDKRNKDVTTYVDLRPYLDKVDDITDIRLDSDGTGSLVYQLYLSQHLPWSDENISDSSDVLQLDVEYDTLNIKVDDTITATLNLRYTGDALALKMVLVEVKAPVGFSFVTDDLDTLDAKGLIDYYEIGPGEASLYIQNVERDKPISLEYRLLCNMPVKAQIQGVHVWDMYNPSVVTEVDPVQVVAVA